MAKIHLEKSPNFWAVLPFYATGAIFFVLLCLLMLFSASQLTQHYFSPQLLAIAHTAALGWGTMLIFGAAYQLLPVIFGKELYSLRWALASFIFLLLGSLGLIYCFWTFHIGNLMITSGALVVLAACCYGINVCVTAAKCREHRFEQAFLISSACWLLVTTVIGLLLAINLAYTFIPRNHLDILKLHAHAGLAGWFLQLITGVSIKLIPMFLLGKSRKTNLLRVAFILQNLGLTLLLLDGLIFPIGFRMLYYASLIFVGMLCWILYLYDTYKHRIRKKIDFLMRQSGLSFLFLLFACIVLPITFFSDNHLWTSLYGMFLFLGWITALILGQTFKTLPFIVWTIHYSKINGKVSVPLPKQLCNDKLIKWQYYAFILAICSLALGICTELFWIIQPSLFLWLAIAIAYCLHVLQIIFHKPKLQRYGN